MATEFFGGMINNSEAAQTKFQKAIEKALINPPEVKVGITPHETIFSENKLKLLHYEPRVKKTSQNPPYCDFCAH